MQFWLLLKVGKNAGDAVELLPYRASPESPPSPITLGKAIAEPKIEEFQFDLEPEPDAEDDLHISAQEGGWQGYWLLHREAHFNLKQKISANFSLAKPQPNVEGRSADLLFALAVATQTLTAIAAAKQAQPPVFLASAIAATGVLEDIQGVARVKKVEGVPDKIRAALGALPAGAWVFYPLGNADEVNADRKLLDEAKQASVELYPVERLDDALAKLGIEIKRLYLTEPYRGLKYFDYEHRGCFEGRDADIAKLLDILSQQTDTDQAGVLILGASGSGKSSLARAGLIPALEQRNANLDAPAQPLYWSAWYPGEADTKNDEAKLAQSILKNWAKATHAIPLAAMAEEPVTTLSELADTLLRFKPKAQRFVWLVDQMEEIFIQKWSPELVAAFAQFLKHIQEQGVCVVGTMRDEYYADYRRDLSKAIPFKHELDTVEKSELEHIIRRPARRAGLQIEGDAQLLADAQELGADVLPLLQFALNRLWENRDTEKGVMVYEPYVALDGNKTNGLKGVISRHADELVAKFSTEEKNALAEVLRRLVCLNDDGIVARQRANLKSFYSDDQYIGMINKLVENRLLVIEGGKDDEEPTVMLAHDFLLAEWKDVQDSINDYHRQLLEEKRKLTNAARHWDRNGRPERLLMASSDEVMRAEILVACVDNNLDDLKMTEKFLWESIRFTRTGFRMFWILLNLCIALMLISQFQNVLSTIPNRNYWIALTMYIMITMLLSPVWLKLFRSIRPRPYINLSRKGIWLEYSYIIFCPMTILVFSVSPANSSHINKVLFYAVFIVSVVFIIRHMLYKHRLMQAVKKNNYQKFFSTKHYYWYAKFLFSPKVWSWRKLEIIAWIFILISSFIALSASWQSAMIMRDFNKYALSYTKFLQKIAEKDIHEEKFADAVEELKSTEEVLKYYENKAIEILGKQPFIGQTQK